MLVYLLWVRGAGAPALLDVMVTLELVSSPSIELDANIASNGTRNGLTSVS